jgi:hypothetical protein
MIKLASEGKNSARYFTAQNEKAGKRELRFIRHFSRSAFKSDEKTVT